MSGFEHELRCRGCGRVHRLSTGVGWRDGVEWRYEQWVCPKCPQLVSRPSVRDAGNAGDVCERCGGELERWSGRVWLEPTPDGDRRERIEGPCPVCATALSERDGTGRIVLWD